MTLLVVYFLLGVPFMAGMLIGFGGKRTERFVVATALTCVYLYAALAVALLGLWLYSWGYGGNDALDLRSYILYQTDSYDFSLSFFIDSMTVLFVCLIGFLVNIVVNYSRYYMHLEPGYQRFFACLMFLMFGLTLIAVAGTLDLLMVGWEFVGICSFFLISFYQNRLDPVRNAFKVLAVYKFCDIGLLLGAWLSQLLWHETQHFSVLNSPLAREHLAAVGTVNLMILSILILIAAAGKSAQWPFSYWLSKAMEGPTPSSAIFYGALSVHAGVLLLHRTHPIWSATDFGPWMVGAIGFLTALVCTGISRVQSNIKGQIAYSSAANVGLIFLELALNLNKIAMLHLVANACLRCYQLLISPSVMSYLLRLQGSSDHQHKPLGWSLERLLPPKTSRYLYVFCIHDGYLERIVYRILWQPVKKFGRFLQRQHRPFYLVIMPILVISILMIELEIHVQVRDIISLLASFVTLGLAAMAFSEHGSALRAWNTATLSALFAGVTVLESRTLNDVLIYASGIVLFWVIGLQALIFMTAKGPTIKLDQYSGMNVGAPGGAMVLFIAFLGVSGFPISPTYIGQDLLLHHAAEESFFLVFILAVSIVINGISLARIYSKVCMGLPLERRKIGSTYRT